MTKMLEKFQEEFHIEVERRKVREEAIVAQLQNHEFEVEGRFDVERVRWVLCCVLCWKGAFVCFTMMYSSTYCAVMCWEEECWGSYVCLVCSVFIHIHIHKRSRLSPTH